VTEYADPDLETIAPLPPAAPVPEAAAPGSVDQPHARSNRVAFVAALVVVSLVVGFASATIALNARDSGSSQAATSPTAPATVPTTPPTAAPRVPADPQAAALGSLILRQSDVSGGNTVQLLDHGADLTVATLDLCNGTFPSEAQRTARRQVALVDTTPTLRMSTEAVLYRVPQTGAQAFSELQSVAAKCPSTPVKSPVGEDTATTTFRTAPDAAWPRTPTVERLAYDFVTASAANAQSSHSIAVYLRRGRALMGVYFATPDGTQVTVAGHSTVAGIVGVFEARMAKLPANVVNG
jgi:hypothetical protein